MNLVEWGIAAGIAASICTVLLTLLAVVGGTAGMGDWRARQRQERELAEEQTKDIRLAREAARQGWSRGAVRTFGVRLVTDPEELARAAAEQADQQVSEYVVLAVNEREPGGNANRANDLRNFITREGELGQAPNGAAYEALQVGREVLAARGDRPT